MYLRASSSRSGRATPRSSRPKPTLRSTLAHGSSAKSWNTNARSGPGPFTGLPLTRTSPPFRGSRPAMILRSVVLPQPLGPSSVESWPFGKLRLTLRSASRPLSYTLATPLTSTSVTGKEPQFEPLQCIEGNRGHGDDGGDRREHLRVIGDRAVVGNDVSNAGRRDQELGDHDADEAHREPEAQAGEDQRRSARQNDLHYFLAPRALERAAHLKQRRVGVADALVGVHHDHWRCQHDHGEYLRGKTD